jgi:hypothetical protein
MSEDCVIILPNLVLRAGRSGFGSRQGLGFFSPPRPGPLCGPPSVVFIGYGRLFTRDKAGPEVKLTTHLNSSIRLHGMVLN